MKEYYYDVNLTFSCVIGAENKKDLIERIKEDFWEEYGINLVREEISNIEEA